MEEAERILEIIFLLLRTVKLLISIMRFKLAKKYKNK